MPTANTSFIFRRTANSPHLGGVQVAFADGSVHFVEIETLPEKLRGLSTIAGEDASFFEYTD